MEAARRRLGDWSGPRGEERAWRCCLMRAVWALKRSARAGRTISLPSLLRLFRRRWADAAHAGRRTRNEAALAGAGAAILDRMYRARQPFERVAWRRVRRDIRLAVQGKAPGKET